MGMCCEKMMTVGVIKDDDDDWVKKCMEYEVDSPRPTGKQKRTWREVVEKDCQARKLNKEDAMDHSRWEEVDEGCPRVRMGERG